MTGSVAGAGSDSDCELSGSKVGSGSLGNPVSKLAAGSICEVLASVSLVSSNELSVSS